MKIGNVILAIFLWLCIPATFFIGAITSAFGGRSSGGEICAIIGPLLLFILGLIILIKGIESNKHNKTNIQQNHPKDDRRCPKCGRIIPMDSRICPYCKNDFEVKKGKKGLF